MVIRNNWLIAHLMHWRSDDREQIMMKNRMRKKDVRPYKSRNSTMSYQSLYSHFYIFLLLILFLFSWHAFAGTTGAELRPAAEKLAGLIGGWGGKTICLTSLTLGLIGLVGRFNPYLVTGSFGTCIVSGLGVSVVNATVTALI